MSNGQPRAFACEFAIIDMQVIGKNGVLLATLTPPANVNASTPVISIKKSASSNSKEGAGGSGSLDYRIVLRYRRIAKPAFPATQYTISTAHVDHPSTPSELSVKYTFTDVPGKLPGPVQTYDFIVTLGYSGGNSPSLNGGDLRYIQLTNPATFEKVKSPMNELSDRAEAYLRFRFSVDFTK